MATLGPFLVRFEFYLTHYNTRMIAYGACKVNTLRLGDVDLGHKLFPFLGIFIFFATSVDDPTLSWFVTTRY